MAGKLCGTPFGVGGDAPTIAVPEASPIRAVTQSTTEGLLLLPYRIRYSPAAEEHLGRLTARQRAIVLDAVDEQLSHEASVETRNRKPLRANPVAPWELRIGPLRVYTMM